MYLEPNSNLVSKPTTPINGGFETISKAWPRLVGASRENRDHTENFRPLVAFEKTETPLLLATVHLRMRRPGSVLAGPGVEVRTVIWWPLLSSPYVRSDISWAVAPVLG